jgi:hypothetical protein
MIEDDSTCQHARRRRDDDKNAGNGIAATRNGDRDRRNGVVTRA